VSSSTCEDKDLGDLKCEIVSDALGEGGTWKTLLAVGSTNVPLQLNGVSSTKLLMIKTNAKDPNATPGIVTIRRNVVGGEEIPITPLSGSKSGHLLISTSSLTGLFASNAGTVDMELTVVTAGD
jgi:hypothetical protein